MNRASSEFYLIAVLALLAGISPAYTVQSAAGQNAVKAEVNRIRKDYLKINAELKTYRKVEARWDAGEHYWNSTDYTGYFDRSDQLALLKFAHGEEGYWSEHEHYFRDGELFFIYVHSGTPDGEEKEERIYFSSKVIVQALLKSKAAGDTTRMADLENKRHDSVMDNIDAASKEHYLSVATEVGHFNEALRK
jgi:hypothetical protein